MNNLSEKIPCVSIVGRPNVGKSTLFNKIIKRQKAIVSPEPGVTRDRNIHTVKLNNSIFNLVDTGGYTSDKDDGFNLQIKEQAIKAIESSDLIIFLVEYDDVTKDDELIGDIIKKSEKEYILVANKVDNEERENYIYQHYELNMGEPIPISVLQGRNLDFLYNIIEQKIPFVEHIINQDDYIKVAIIGKPNTGKSSLLNKIVGEERSIVSPIPGTTRDSVEVVIEYKNNQLLFVDTAGIRRKNRVTENIEFYSVRKAIQSVEHADVAVLMIDALDNLTDQDKKIAGITMQRNIGLIIVVNKWDLVENEYKSFAAYEDYLRFKFAIADYIPVINTSVLKGKNINKLLDTIISVYKEYNKRVDTGEFNRFLQNLVDSYPPKTKSGKFRIYYGTQISSAPIKFVFFCNNPKNCPKQYLRYITNKIREKYNFKGIPIDIKLKGKEKSKEI